MKSKSMIFVLVLMAAIIVVISGCTSPTPTATPTAVPTAAPTATPAATTVLTINGSVANETAFTLDELKALPQIQVNESTTNKANVTNTVQGSGVLLSTLLAKASPAANATNVTFIGSDGYSKTTGMANVTASPNASVVIYEDGTLRNVIPGVGYGTWVGNLSVITIG